MKIGFIGLGSQGGPMAQRLVEAGYPLMLWARRSETLEPFRGTAVQFAESIAALGARCEIVCVCVVDDAGVAEVCDRLMRAMPAGGIVVIHSTIHPDSCTALGEKARPFGLSVVDAPVSGGGMGAAAGTLTVMIGGDDGAVARVKPLFEAFGKLIVHLGPLGSGQKAKLVNNALMAANMASAHSALSCAEELGIRRDVLVQLIQASTGRSFGFDVYARQTSLGAFAHGAKLLSKDVTLLSDVAGADSAGAEGLRRTAMPFLDLVGQMADSSSPR